MNNDQVKNRLKLFHEDLDATLQMSSIKMLEFNETIEKAKRDVDNFITEINNAELSQRIDALNTKIIEMSDHSILSFNDHKKRINDGFVEISRNLNNKIRILLLVIFFLFIYIILVDHVF